MKTPPIARRPLIPALAASLLLLTAACSSGKPAQPGPDFGSPPLVSALTQASVVECAIHRGLIPPSVLNSQQNYFQWYRDRRVIINVAFGTWCSLEQDAVVKGRILRQWAAITASQRKLPLQLCGSTAIPTPHPTT